MRLSRCVCVAADDVDVSHRIGQTKDVKVYRLITRGTYELEMFERASLKLGLDQAVLHKMETDAAAQRGASRRRPCVA